MPEIQLKKRYPDLKDEDIEDAYCRGFQAGIQKQIK